MTSHNTSQDLVQPSHTTLSRREFVQTSSAGALGLGLAAWIAPSAGAATTLRAANDNGVIVIMNVGGMSQLDTFDPKPLAPSEIRSPFRAMRTRSPEFEITELLPRHAAIADKFSIVRTCHHEGPTTHDESLQMVQTGMGHNAIHIGAAIAAAKTSASSLPYAMLLPHRLGDTGARVSQGQAGLIACDDRAFEASQQLLHRAAHRESPRAAERYGNHRLGQNCLQARQLVEAGAKFVAINAFDTVFHQPSWDVHGVSPFATMSDVRDGVAPAFDRAYAALITDLAERGLLETTLVCCLTEFGRTPRLNRAGGRDHWPHCYSITLAGGGIAGGRAIGASDAAGAYPTERPVHAREVLATILAAAGLNGGLVGAEPIHELFA